MSTFLRETRTGCARSLLIQVLAVLIVVPLACVLIFVPLTLVNRSDASIWWLIVPAGLFLLILLGGGIGALVLVLSRRTRQADALFTPLGLVGSPYSLFFRQYHGTVQGRSVAVYYYRGPTLEIDVETPLQTRLAVTGKDADTMFLVRLLDRDPLALDDPKLSAFTALGLDEAWSRDLLAQTRTPGLLQRLIRFEGAFTRRHVILRPGWLRLHLFGSRNLLDFTLDVTPDQARQWLDDLLALLRLAESLPAPQVTDEESAAERMARSIRDSNPYLAPGIIVGAIVAVIGCAIAIGVAAFLFAAAQ
jgi:hypothetical protein